MTGEPPIRADGWARHNLWEHSATVRDLYRRRCRREAPEMDAHAQAAELLALRVAPGDRVLDAGCGSGYFFHALGARGVPAEYWGIDATETLIAIGREEMPAHGLPAERLQTIRLEDLDGAVEHVVCINVLSNLDNWPRPLERLLSMARKSVILRECVAETASYAYVRDAFLDPGVDLHVHVNHCAREEILAFIAGYGFRAEVVVDRRTGGRAEMVIDHPHHWTFIVADRIADT